MFKKVCFGALPARLSLLLLFVSLLISLLGGRYPKVLQVAQDTTSSTTGGTRTSG